MYTYNTTLPPIHLKKYGRNLQNLLEHVASLPNKEDQKNYTDAIIHLIKNIFNSKAKSNQTNEAQLLNEIFIASGQKLNLDPDKVTLPTPIQKEEKQKITYNQTHINFKCCGKHLKALMKMIVEEFSKNPEANQKQQLFALVKLVQNLHKKNTNLPHTLQHIEQVTKQKFPISHQEIETELLPRKNKQKKSKA